MQQHTVLGGGDVGKCVLNCSGECLDPSSVHATHTPAEVGGGGGWTTYIGKEFRDKQAARERVKHPISLFPSVISKSFLSREPYKRERAKGAE